MKDMDGLEELMGLDRDLATELLQKSSSEQ